MSDGIPRDKLCEMLTVAEKRIEELEAVGRELLIEAMDWYSYYPNNFRKDVEDYFAEEIKVFGISEGGAEYEHITREAMEASLKTKGAEGGADE